MHVSSFLKKELDHLFTVLDDRKSKRSVSQLKGEIISLRMTQKSQASFGKRSLTQSPSLPYSERQYGHCAQVAAPLEICWE